ncbi:MAG: FAD-dependent oxidoreductase, partial [Lachnospiraceae bacterium]|nr:FAD-dependent oxidoreductase [Lachnospiraceae bacterium]
MGRVIVIGGGAAGMMAAVAAAEQGHHVILLEKNEKLGKKIYITGKGRCNVTNDCDMEELFDNVVTNSKFLYSAFYTFDNQRMKEYLEEDGCRLKVERGNRVFPVSDHASDVIGALKRRMNRLGVQVFLNTEVKEILKADGEDSVVGVLLTNGKKEPADAVILAG